MWFQNRRTKHKRIRAEDEMTQSLARSLEGRATRDSRPYNTSDSESDIEVWQLCAKLFRKHRSTDRDIWKMNALHKPWCRHKYIYIYVCNVIWFVTFSDRTNYSSVKKLFLYRLYIEILNNVCHALFLFLFIQCIIFHIWFNR